MKKPYIILSLLVLGLATGACSALTDFSEDAPRENCVNGTDDDGDGFIDCDDQDCQDEAVCRGGEICDNFIDDDGDLLIDCEDPDCATHQACNVGAETECGNGIDDDGDGFTDCADQDCLVSPECQLLDEICDNNIDDNGDGLIDCEDTLCVDSQVCTGGCTVDFAWFDTDAEAVCLGDASTCTFQSSDGPVSGEIVPMCSPVMGQYYTRADQDLCPKGAANINGVCVTFCSPQHVPCPEADWAVVPVTPNCRSRDLSPRLSGYHFCVLEASCEPLGGVGCPADHSCKFDVLLKNETGSEVMVVTGPYCTIPFGSRAQDEECAANEECADHMACVKYQGETQGTCQPACRATNPCDNSHTCSYPEGTDITDAGFCLPIDTAK